MVWFHIGFYPSPPDTELNRNDAFWWSPSHFLMKTFSLIKPALWGPTVSLYTKGNVHTESHTWRRWQPTSHSYPEVHGENALLSGEWWRGTARPLGRTQDKTACVHKLRAGQAALSFISVPSDVHCCPLWEIPGAYLVTLLSVKVLIEWDRKMGERRWMFQ